jgi:hypothetical protein
VSEQYPIKRRLQTIAIELTWLPNGNFFDTLGSLVGAKLVG